MKLSPTTELIVQKLFAAEHQEEARRVLREDCGNNIPLLQEADEYRLERIRFAALKLSAGDLEALRRAAQLAYTDWRDLLMAADFGKDLKAHVKWAQSLLPLPNGIN